MERYFQIGRVNLKYNLFPHILLSILVLCISPFLLGVENLDASKTARILELYAALIGIILITPIFLPEQNKDIKELVEAKYTRATTVYFIRIIEAGFSLAILIGIYVLILKYSNCTFPVINYYFGTLAEALFLGGMGLCAYSLFDQIAIAYMLPMVYYILAIGGGSKLLKNFYLFSMIYGGYQEKIYLTITGVFLILFGISYQYIVKKIVPRVNTKLLRF